MSQSLIDKIENFINAQENWVTKGQIYDLCEQEGYSPENGARRCRELAEEGKIITDTYKSNRGTNLVRYAKVGEVKPIIIKPRIEIRNGQAYMMSID